MEVSSNEAKQPMPELMVAAMEGDWRRLVHLLGNGDATQPDELVPQVVVEVHTPPRMKPAETVTTGMDTILHVVAWSGDSDDYLKSATVICASAKSNLLCARNRKGDTPLHCAARAGRIRMVSRLIGLAVNHHYFFDVWSDVKVLLRMQNEQGETALHEAIRLADKNMVKEMVDLLMTADPALAHFPRDEGTSPLYLAFSLGHDDIAEQLHQLDEGLSYCGPNGENALHVVVLGSTDTANKLLGWNENLLKQGDYSSGSTPLHIAVSRSKLPMIKTLLNHDRSSAYQSDKHGSFPIHVAAMENNTEAVSLFLPQCGQLRDSTGRSFLHVAVSQDSNDIVSYACRLERKCAPLLNLQDNQGNTVLHLAVEVNNIEAFTHLIKNTDVQLSLWDNGGRTPMDVSWGLNFDWTSPKFQLFLPYLYPQGTGIRMFGLLTAIGAKFGAYRHRLNPIRERKIREKIPDNTLQIIGLGSVLIATVAFTAAFTLPGGYRADDHPHGGTATFAKHCAFDVFIVANTLALICACVTTISLIYVGVATDDTEASGALTMIALYFLSSSAKSLGAAFALAMYLVLAPVAPTTAVASCVITMIATISDFVWYMYKLGFWELLLVKRLGIQTLWRFAVLIGAISIRTLWPCGVIAIFLACSKVRGVH